MRRWILILLLALIIGGPWSPLDAQTPGVTTAKICGMANAVAGRASMVKMWADDDASDHAAALADARSLVRTAESCLYNISSCDISDGSCDDAGQVLVNSDILLGQHYITRSLAFVDASSFPSALGTELRQAEYIRKAHDINAQSQPYNSARDTLGLALKTAAGLHNMGAELATIEPQIAALEDCAARIGLNLTW